MQTGEQIRVMVLDDDLTFRHNLVRTFESIDQARVTRTASTVQEAQHYIEQGEIDLVTLEVTLRGGSGLDLIRWINARSAKVITVIVTRGTDKKASQSIDAVLLGAAGLVLKPSGPDAGPVLKNALEKIILTACPKVVVAPGQAQSFSPTFPEPREVIAVGSSTGGPPVMLQLLKTLPMTCMVPILVTQHMAAEHIPSFANMLAYEAGRAVYLARDGDVVQPGSVYVAASGRHLCLSRRDGRLVIVQNDGAEENFCKPAVDPMFRSVADVCGKASVGVVLTGMGSDGAKGASALRAVFAPVLVQDQATSVVWGMPGATAALGAVSAIVPGPKLGVAVAQLVSQHLTVAHTGKST